MRNQEERNEINKFLEEIDSSELPINERILSAILSRFKSINEFSELAPISYGSLLAYTRGYSLPGFVALRTIIAITNVRADWLLFGVGPMHGDSPYRKPMKIPSVDKPPTYKTLKEMCDESGVSKSTLYRICERLPPEQRLTVIYLGKRPKVKPSDFYSFIEKHRTFSLGLGASRHAARKK